jgi:hypothetical protein
VATQTSSQLPELSLTLTWAQQAGVVRKVHGKLGETTTWKKASPEERFRRAAQALVSIGPLQARHSRTWGIFHEVFAVVDSTFPSLLMRLADGPMSFEDAVDQLHDDMQRRYIWSGWLEDPASLRQEMHNDLRTTVTLLVTAGIGATDEEGLITLTPAGSWVIPELKLPSRAPLVYSPVVSPSETVHELRVTLDVVTPAVWRDFVLPSGASLASLHRALQAVMGWEGYHLHEFNIEGRRYGVDDGESWDEPPLDERQHRLRELLDAGATFQYTYDFGDGWDHTIEVRAVRPAFPAEVVPRCTDGARACPPEDVGGFPGYAEMLASLGDPSHDERERYLEWLGGPFDPDRLDLDRVNDRLRELAGGRTKA